jgi:HlyD family secretion protein
MSLVPNIDRAVRALNRQVAVGVVLAGIMVAATGSWAALGTIQDAVMVPGVVVVNSQKKKIQHPDGGLVSEIDVEDGRHVEAGTILLRLDGKQVNADMGTVRRRIFELSAKKWRLVAERDGLQNLMPWVAPSIGGSDPNDDSDLAAILASQRQLFDAKRSVVQQQKLQIRERIDQLARQVDGLDSVQEAREKQLTIVREELSKLFELAKGGLVPMTRWTPVQREEAQLIGDIGQTKAEKAKARGQMAEFQLKLIEIDQSYRKDSLDDLQAVEGELSQLVEKRVGLEAKLKRLDVLARVSGRIHELSVHTIGGVVAAGETLAFIIPDGDLLVVDALVPPREIDRVRQGAPARLRFTSFDRTTTPELSGHVAWVSPDQEAGAENKSPAFRVRIGIDADELKRLNGAAIGPGMEAEVMVTGPNRTVLSFIVKPLSDQLERTFRER